MPKMKKMINNKKMKRKGFRKLEREVEKMGPPVIIEERPSPEGLPPKEDNYGQFSKGGEVCRGAGAAIKGTKFEGVF